MPKIKTNKAASKRFRVRANGSVKRKKAFRNHMLTCKTTNNKRHLRADGTVHSANMRHVRGLLPYSF